MVGDVQHALDLRDVLEQRLLHTLLQCHVGHAATLATAAELQVRGAVVDRHQGDLPSVAGDGGVDLVVEHFLDGFGQRSAK